MRLFKRSEDRGHAKRNFHIHPSSVYGRYELVFYRASGRGAGANCVLSRNLSGCHRSRPVALANGSCTDGPDGAFSGAALASQALSELSQTTTQVTTKEIGKSVAERRDQERERSRRRPVAEPARAVPSRRRPVAEPARAVPPQLRSRVGRLKQPRKSSHPRLRRLRPCCLYRSNLPSDLGPGPKSMAIIRRGTLLGLAS